MNLVRTNKQFNIENITIDFLNDLMYIIRHDKKSYMYTMSDFNLENFKNDIYIGHPDSGIEINIDEDGSIVVMYEGNVIESLFAHQIDYCNLLIKYKFVDFN